MLCCLFQFPNVINLNVGGRHFTTHLSTLTKYPNSMLAVMFSGRHPVPIDPEGRCFIDVNGDVFSHILDFLRTEELPPAKDALKVYKTALYFGLQDLADKLCSHSTQLKESFLKKHILYGDYPDILNEVIGMIEKYGCERSVFGIMRRSFTCEKPKCYKSFKDHFCKDAVLKNIDSTTLKELLKFDLERKGFVISVEELKCPECDNKMTWLKVSWE